MRKHPSAALHPRNRHQGRYDLAWLTGVSPTLAGFLIRNPDGDPTIDFSDPDWELRLATAFEEKGTARLVANASEARLFRAALVRLSASPVSVGVLQFFPAIERIERADGRIFATLTLREQV